MDLILGQKKSTNLDKESLMKHIFKLLGTLHDETGLPTPALIVGINDLGWHASVKDEGMVLLCAAGETYLSTSGHDSAEDAVEALDNIAKDGFDLQERWLRKN